MGTNLPASAPSPLIRNRRRGPTTGALRGLVSGAIHDPEAHHAMMEGLKRGLLLDNPFTAGIDLAAAGGQALARPLLGNDTLKSIGADDARLSNILRDVGYQTGFLDPKYDNEGDATTAEDARNQLLSSTARLGGGVATFGLTGAGLRSSLGQGAGLASKAVRFLGRMK